MHSPDVALALARDRVRQAREWLAEALQAEQEALRLSIATPAMAASPTCPGRAPRLDGPPGLAPVGHDNAPPHGGIGH